MLSAYREFLPGAPRTLNGFFGLPHRAAGAALPRGDFPDLRKACCVVWCHLGSPEEAAAAMAPLSSTSLPEPLMHGVGPMPHADLQSLFDGLYPPGDQWYWRADFVKEVPDEAVSLHARFGAAMPTIKSAMHLYPDRRAARDVAQDTAWSYRDATSRR